DAEFVDALRREARVEGARGDVEGDREVAGLRGLPDRVPVPVAEDRLAVRLRLAGEEHALVAELRAALDLLHRRGDVPERRGEDRGEAARGGRDPLDQGVVVGLHAGGDPLAGLGPEEGLAAEAADG